MCGICGIISFSDGLHDDHLLKAMMKSMKHRGPDDEGTFLDNKVGLGFVRLSILDLSPAGHQPMLSADGRYVIIFNGEIYNYIELREELSVKGHVFNTRTDTEVLLAAYHEWGEECLDRFNGMWAFIIYDRHTKELFAARDRFGVKPFYYYLGNDQFIFASEIPPILEVWPEKAEADLQSVFDYLVFNRTDQTSATFFRNIHKLQHGHKVKIRLSETGLVSGGGDCVKISRWYNLRSSLKEPFQSPLEYRDAFSSAVGLRLRSDVPVGVCLSGGVDSSSIVSTLLSDYHKDDLKTFSAVYGKGNKGDESDFIDEYRTVLKHMFYTHPSAETLRNDLGHYVKAHGEPLPSTGPYAQFKVMELAHGNVVVTLDGQGADEQLAGYHYFFGFFFKDLVIRGRLMKLADELYHYCRNHRSVYGIKTMAYFLLPKRIRTKLRVSEKGYLYPDFIARYRAQNTIAGNLYGSDNLQESLIDHFEYKLEHLLKWEDRNSMWFSIESRVPYLDYRLVERTLSLPSTQVIRKGMTKHFLRESMRGIVPEKIRLRKDKVGFVTPEDEWFRTPGWKEIIFGILRSDSFRSRHLIIPEEALKQYQEHLDGKKNISKEIWKWVNLETWFRTFIDK